MGSPANIASTWAHVSNTLEALRDMVHEGSTLEWEELISRVGGVALPALLSPKRRPVAATVAGVQRRAQVVNSKCMEVRVADMDRENGPGPTGVTTPFSSRARRVECSGRTG